MIQKKTVHPKIISIDVGFPLISQREDHFCKRKQSEEIRSKYYGNIKKRIDITGLNAHIQWSLSVFHVLQIAKDVEYRVFDLMKFLRKF